MIGLEKVNAEIEKVVTKAYQKGLEEKSITIQELINKFANNKQWIDICTPTGRLSGTKEKILSEYDYQDVKVSDWRVTLTNVLEIDL